MSIRVTPLISLPCLVWFYDALTQERMIVNDHDPNRARSGVYKSSRFYSLADSVKSFSRGSSSEFSGFRPSITRKGSSGQSDA